VNIFRHVIILYPFPFLLAVCLFSYSSSSVVDEYGIEPPKKHIAQESITAADFAEEARLQRNFRDRKSYAARVLVKAAASAKMKNDCVAKEAAANLRKLHRAQVERDRYHKKKPPHHPQKSH
jgi:hypothetical protein